jgi:predicted nucleic acid-binding protein
MLRDVVIDTNVFAHAQNPIEPRFPAACRFLDDLLRQATMLCVDPGFHPDESCNTSLIGAEYLQRLRAGSPAFEVVLRLFSSQRIREVPRETTPQMRRRIVRLIRDSRDRTFVIVALNSDEKVVVSHDFSGGLQRRKRRAIRRETGVEVLDAAQCCVRL